MSHGEDKGKEVKVDISECQDSEYDKIIKGNTKNINVIHEDNVVIAFQETNPIA